MAFIDFASAAPGAVAMASARERLHEVAAPTARKDGGLSPIEWLVVANARREGPASLRQPGRIATALGSLFGAHTPRPLADPKLEALRRLAVHAWRHSFAVPVSAVKAFIAAGYTVDQYEKLLASISSARIADQRR